LAAYYLDSSAAAKLYVSERGTTWLTGLTDPAAGHELFVVRITAVEVAAALFRRARAGALPPTAAANAVRTLRRDLQRTFRIVEFSLVVVDLAVDVAERHGLRGYDCVQLAAALAIQRPRTTVGLGALTMVSADAELNVAARAEGLGVVDPNSYP
jgi:predicted nucleic acid-binding protein